MAAVTLQAVRASPTTLQYAIKTKSPHARPSYVRKFFPNERVQATFAQPWLAKTDPLMPPYPYGRNNHFEEANHGLYGGATVQSGHKISKGRNKGKTLRKWYPNVRVETLRSEALNVEMHIPTTARCMRTIRKCGGLDQYLLGEKPARIKELGLLGWKLRWLVLKSQAVREQHAKERQKLGLPAGQSNPYSAESTFVSSWADEGVRAEILKKMIANWDALVEQKNVARSHLRRTLKTSAEKLKSVKALDLYHPAKMGEYEEFERMEVDEEELPSSERVPEPPAPAVKGNKARKEGKKVQATG